MNSSSLLLIEDNPGDVRLLREMFAEDGSGDVKLTQVGSMHEAELLLADSVVDIILLDLGLPDTQGLGAVQRAHAAAPRVPLVVLTGLDDESMAVQALQEGAQDYLVKGQIEARSLLRSLRYAIERKLMEDALFVEKERAQVTLNCIADGVICTNLSGDITFLNAVAEQMTGWSREEAEGRPVGEVFRLLENSGKVVIAAPPGSVPGPDTPEKIQERFILVRRDGTECSIEQSVAPIRDREGLLSGAVVVLRDVSEARASALRMAHLAQHDFLTGLPNRALLSDRINQAVGLSRRNSKQTAVLFLDLDGFKHINDSLGHSIGDELLQSIAKRLMDCARASDTVSRQGGDEFIVLLSEMHRPEDAAIAARRILQAVSEAHHIGQHELHVTTSIGVSVYPDDGLDAETLIKNADTALYQAKENGRQSYQFFKPEMNARAVARQSMEQNLRRALERGEFSLQYQPKVDCKTGVITGAEALLRWTHPTRGAVSPAEFIPVAEDCGLILPIGNWVLREACRQARAWQDAGLPRITTAVNVSAKEFRDENFLAGLFTVLNETGLDPSTLELELTESVLMKHSESAAAILASLRGRGVRVAVDDFGTGYSSLSYLRKFPVDALKIDQSFVSQITGTGGDASIVTAVISMAGNLKLRVVAEGVETLEQLTFLRDHECDEAQGYYFSRPITPAAFAQLQTSGIRVPMQDGATEGPAPLLSRSRAAHRWNVPGSRTEREKAGEPRAGGQLTGRSVDRLCGNSSLAPSRASVEPGARNMLKEQILWDSVDQLKLAITSSALLLHDSAAQNDTLLELGRFKDELVTMIVHDLNNPLSVILANYDYILEGFDGPTERRQALEDSQSAGRRMLRLLSNLVDVTRLEDGRLQIRPARLNLAGLIQPLLEQRRVLARADDISIELLVSSLEIMVTVDADLVSRTIENILDNARRYAGAGGRIVLDLRSAGSHVEIRVGNSGPPIPVESREAIFNKYGSVPGRTRRQDLGLGLYFCRVATEAQGGQLSIEQTERLPAIFCIRLPQVVAGVSPTELVATARRVIPS